LALDKYQLFTGDKDILQADPQSYSKFVTSKTVRESEPANKVRTSPPPIFFTEKNGFVTATKLGRTNFLLLQPKILLQQPNVLLIELNILLL